MNIFTALLIYSLVNFKAQKALADLGCCGFNETAANYLLI